MNVNGNSGDEKNLFTAIRSNFLGSAPRWYKLLIISYLIINPILFYINPFVAGWVLMAEFISTLALSIIYLTDSSFKYALYLSYKLSL